MEISMLPIHALSIRTCATMFPPSSATAMFMGWPISLAFFSAALITRRASSNSTAVMGSPFMCYAAAPDRGISRADRCTDLLCLRHRPICGAPGFRRRLLDQVCDFFRVRKHWHVTGGNSNRCSLYCRRFGLLKLRRNSAIVAGNHAPRWLGRPRGGGDRGPKNSRGGGALCRRQQLLLVVCQILGEVFSDSLWGHAQKTFSIRPDFAA